MSLCNNFCAVFRSSWSRNSHNPAASTACWAAWEFWGRRDRAVGEAAEDGAGGGTGSRGGLIYPYYQLRTAPGCWFQQVQYRTLSLSVLSICLHVNNYMRGLHYAMYFSCFHIHLLYSKLLICWLVCRHNKLCVDEMDAAGRETLKQVEGVATFVPVCSHPLDGHHVSQVSLGPNHTLFLTGGCWCLLFCHWEFAVIIGVGCSRSFVKVCLWIELLLLLDYRTHKPG